MREQSQDQVMETGVLVLADDYANDVFNKSKWEGGDDYDWTGLYQPLKDTMMDRLVGSRNRVANEMQIFKEIASRSTTTICADFISVQKHDQRMSSIHFISPLTSKMVWF